MPASERQYPDSLSLPTKSTDLSHELTDLNHELADLIHERADLPHERADELFDELVLSLIRNAVHEVGLWQA